MRFLPFFPAEGGAKSEGADDDGARDAAGIKKAVGVRVGAEEAVFFNRLLLLDCSPPLALFPKALLPIPRLPFPCPFGVPTFVVLYTLNTLYALYVLYVLKVLNVRY